MSKSNLKEGDIVLVEFYPDSIDYGDADLLLMGLGKRYDMYRFFHPAMWGKIITAYPSYLKKNCNYCYKTFKNFFQFSTSLLIKVFVQFK